MEIESSKTAVFVEAIQALAKEQCDKIDRETEELRKQRIDAMQESAKARYDAYTEYETARINAEFNREISKLTETSRGQLTQQRSEIFDRVFAAVDEKLRAFVQTPAYRDLLLASAKKLASVLSGDAVTLYLRPADKAFEEDSKKEQRDGLGCSFFDTKKRPRKNPSGNAFRFSNFGIPGHAGTIFSIPSLPLRRSSRAVRPEPEREARLRRDRERSLRSSPHVSSGRRRSHRSKRCRRSG